ncbi:MAG: hypothetical protein QOJ03_1738 [Frankiaceae bacterium]|nr:hypothetical protein [Frankiaceae bacterium]
MPELDRLVRRLRGLSPSGWRYADRAQTIRRLAADLVAIGGAGHELPAVPDYALADVIAVVGEDAYAADPLATEQLVAAAWGQLS